MSEHAGSAKPPLRADMRESLADRVYDAIYEEEDARACADISEDACTNVPANFFLTAVSMSLTKLGDALINAKTSLPWLLASLGSPAWIAAILVPVRESGSMLPQLAVASWIRRLPLRKWTVVVGTLVQAACVLAIGGCALVLEGALAGLAILSLVVFFSLARGFCSVGSKDVLGKTVPKRRRGRVTGVSAGVAGVGTLVCAIGVWRSEELSSYLWIFFGGGLLWLAAAVIYARIVEEPGATEGGSNGLLEAFRRLSILRDDADFRRFVIVRSLLVGTALMAPFLVLLARERSDASLAYFLGAQGAASMLGGPLWGSFADRSSRQVLVLTGFSAGLLGLLVVAVVRWSEQTADSTWFLPLVFFVLAALHDGVRLGRKTYVVDLGSGNKRTDFVAVSNTVLGVVLLLAGAVAAMAEQLAPGAAILILALMAFAAAYLGRRLPEEQH